MTLGVSIEAVLMLPVVWSWLPLTAKCLSSASAGSRRYHGLHGNSFQIVACGNNRAIFIYVFLLDIPARLCCCLPGSAASQTPLPRHLVRRLMIEIRQTAEIFKGSAIALLDYPTALPLKVHIFAMPLGRPLLYLHICYRKLFRRKKAPQLPTSLPNIVQPTP